MKHMRALNRKAARISEYVASQSAGVHALQDPRPAQTRPHIPTGMRVDVLTRLGSGFGWRHRWFVSAGRARYLRLLCELLLARAGAGHLNNSPDWASKCAAATKDWRNLDLIFPLYLLFHAPTKLLRVALSCLWPAMASAGTLYLPAYPARVLVFDEIERSDCRPHPVGDGHADVDSAIAGQETDLCHDYRP